MTTLEAIALLAKQIEYVYETVDDFDASMLRSELEIADENRCIYISYNNAGDGRVKLIEFTYMKKYVSGKWIKVGGFGINEQLLLEVFSGMMKEHFSVKQAEWNEEHAGEIAEAERQYYEDAYYDNKMCIALGK